MSIKVLEPWNKSSRTHIRGFVLPIVPDPHSQIRLIRLEADGENRKLSCTLETHELKQAPKYAAISYTWGDPTPVDDLDVHGQQLKVHHNCYYALWQAHLHKNTDELFWLDAICIDQNNLQEKSAQVQLMGSIFTTADRVVVSLGPHADGETLTTSYVLNQPLTRRPDSAYLLQVALELDASDWCMKRQISGEQRRTLKGKWMDAMNFTNSASLERLKIAWIRFCCRPYFCRLWILQEIVLPSMVSIDLLIDSELMNWMCLLQLLDDVTLDMLKTDEWDATYLSRVINTKNRYEIGLPRLHDAVFLSIGADCSDPRDKIYGLLSLVWWPDGPAPIPDYSKPVFELAMEATKRLNQQGLLLVGAERLLEALDIDANSPEMTALIAQRAEHHPSMDDLRRDLDCDVEIRTQTMVFPGFCCKLLAGDGDGRIEIPARRRASGSEVPPGTLKSEWKILMPNKAFPIIAHEVCSKVQNSGAVALLPPNSMPGDVLLYGTDCDAFQEGVCLVIRSVTDKIYRIIGQAIRDPSFRICSGSSDPGCDCISQGVSVENHRNFTSGFRICFAADDLLSFVGQTRGVKDAADQRRRHLNRPNVQVVGSPFSSFAIAEDPETLREIQRAEPAEYDELAASIQQKMEQMSNNFLAHANAS